jgi:SsrA-binding protein
MSSKVEIKNKKAKFEYEFVESFTAGIQLFGTEIKSIRNSKASITESYAVMIKNELFIRNMYVGDYENSGHFNHESKRDRKLLLNKIELNKINKKLKNKGLTIVPTKLFIGKNGWAKLNISVAKGKKIYDKREDLKTKDIKREIDRSLKKFK